MRSGSGNSGQQLQARSCRVATAGAKPKTQRRYCAAKETKRRREGGWESGRTPCYAASATATSRPVRTGSRAKRAWERFGYPKLLQRHRPVEPFSGLPGFVSLPAVRAEPLTSRSQPSGWPASPVGPASPRIFWCRPSEIHGTHGRIWAFLPKGCCMARGPSRIRRFCVVLYKTN
jgi:hypothetical protein